MSVAPTLIFGWGNPSRGDDALGPLFLEGLAQALPEALASGRVELLSDFQLQVEHALDIADRERVIFVDASVVATAPYSYEPVTAARDPDAGSHWLSPAAVLAVHAEVLGGPAPAAWLLAIRGETFELGQPLSAPATERLAAALSFLTAMLRASEP